MCVFESVMLWDAQLHNNLKRFRYSALLNCTYKSNSINFARQKKDIPYDMKAALVDERALKLLTFLVFINVIFTKRRVLSNNETNIIMPCLFYLL